ncbi:MAG: type II toxin-antitoxin system Phd/YefM family antitoxin [Oscillospiraceae bacterium]|nr:type II toxin-antitoxin system Phd/YefM family antitoxin [Oscillospiraceae bacterium]
MIQIRPVSDLRNKFPEIEGVVNGGEPVFLTKNGYGSMVVMSLAKYSQMAAGIESALDEADRFAEMSNVRYTHDEVFARVKGGNYD